MFLCSPPSFTERNATTTLHTLILGFFVLFYSCVFSFKSSGYKKLCWFVSCFCLLLFLFLDAASHLPSILSILPRHGETMFPRPKSSWHHAQMNKTYPRLLSPHQYKGVNCTPPAPLLLLWETSTCLILDYLPGTLLLCAPLGQLSIVGKVFSRAGWARPQGSN